MTSILTLNFGGDGGNRTRVQKQFLQSVYSLVHWII